MCGYSSIITMKGIAFVGHLRYVSNAAAVLSVFNYQHMPIYNKG